MKIKKIILTLLIACITLPFTSLLKADVMNTEPGCKEGTGGFTGKPCESLNTSIQENSGKSNYSKWDEQQKNNPAQQQPQQEQSSGWQNQSQQSEDSSSGWQNQMNVPTQNSNTQKEEKNSNVENSNKAKWITKEQKSVKTNKKYDAYYVQKNNEYLTGWHKVNMKLFLFNQKDTKYSKKGQLYNHQGWYKSTSSKNKGKYMFFINYKKGFAYNQKISIKGKQYSFDKDGFLKK